MKLLILMVLALMCFRSTAHAYEGRRANSVLLNGEWEFALGEGDEQAEMLEGQKKLDWKQATLPGPFMQWSEGAATNIKFAWAKRTFHVSESQAKSLAVLRWNRIELGAVAFINGQKVGENEPTGPYQGIVPNGVLKPGENEIVLKIPGAAGVRKAKSGYFLIPAGFGSCHKRGIPAVTDDVWIDFADTAYMKWVLAMPDLDDSKVNIRVTPAGLERVDDIKIVAQVMPWPDGEVVGKGEASARIMPDSSSTSSNEHFVVQVPMPGFKPWTYEDCNLYTAQIKLMKDGKILDELSFRFGMREIKVVDSNYKLNGKNLRLRGSNLVFEWDWGDVITGKEKDYLVTEAREMSMNSFRTHTRPLPRLWADICDEYGTMILAEFPCLYNYRDYKFTPEEYEIWHENVLTDAAGWMMRLWNHPSVIMWVLSNESRRDNEWEEGPYQDFVNQLDPTRPTLRTGTTGTRDNFDVHTCGNTVGTAEGQLLRSISGWFPQAKGRTLTNTEYMNSFSRPLEQWTGKQDREADRLAYAQLGMEHTEAMRRARLDGMWPYMYAGWTRTRTGREWKAGFAQPVSACWHSSLSPVLASLDLFDPNYLTGQEVTTDLYLINDSWHDASIHVDLLLTDECPEFIPEAECFDEPLASWSFDFELEADSLTTTPITWKLPDEEGSYWLTARTTGIPGRPVLSQRFVRAIKSAKVPDSAEKRTFIMLGGGSAASAYFESKGLRTSRRLNDLKPDENVVIIWNASKLTAADRSYTQSLKNFAAAGGRIIVLSTKSWDWQELCNVSMGKPNPLSRAFAYDGVTHPMLSGIRGDWLMRWNGLPGTVAVSLIEESDLEDIEKLIWAREIGAIVAAEIPAANGGGKILFSQLDIQSHVDKSKHNYDPVAERILLNLLGQ